jgi:hypothetical protein
MSLAGDSEPKNWRTSRHSIGNGECVEVASVNQDVVVRDSKNPSGPSVRYPSSAWREFVMRESRRGR